VPDVRHTEPTDPLDGPPVTTAKAWAVADGATGEILWRCNDAERLRMASLTKIMTAWIILDLAQAQPAILSETVVYRKRPDDPGGTSADLNDGDRGPARDLLYGLLLPSGNDAALALGEHFGPRFAVQDDEPPEDPLAPFVAEMNRRADALCMAETTYFDPHGFSANVSSARDIVTVTWHAMRLASFREYVQTEQYACTLTTADGADRPMAWQNTNKLLPLGYDGVKTGRTKEAGRCLVASGRRGDDHLITVVLGCPVDGCRYADTRNLFRWAWRMRGRGSARTRL